MDKKHRIKIAQVIGNAQSGGVISCVLNFYRHIDKDEFQFDFFTYGKSSYDEEIRALGGRVFYFSRVENLTKSYFQLKKYFEQEDYFAVHAHLTTLSILPLFAAKMAKIPHRICHAHSTTHRKEKFWVVKSILKRFSKRFATNLSGCSIYSCNWLYGGMDNVFLLHNAIDLERFAYLEQKDSNLTKQYGWENKKVIGSIGRLVWQKNFPFLLNAFAIVSQKVDNAILVIVGSGKDKDKLLKQIDKLNLQNKVHILPEIRAVENYYKTFDLFVMTSRFEGLPLVAVEAQAVGVPCLLSQHITSEVNISGQCQFLPTQSGVWAEKIIEMLNYPRFDVTSKLIEAGYEIKSEASRLQNYYLELE